MSRVYLFVLGALVGVGLMISPTSVEAAAASLHWRALATASSLPVGDNERYVAYRALDGTTRIYDARLNSTSSTRTPDGCDEPAAIGGGVLLWACRQTGRGIAAPMLFDLRTRHQFEPVGSDAFVQTAAQRYPAVTYDAVGSQGIAITGFGPSVTDRLVLNWRTGQVRQQPTSRSVVTDLSRSTLVRPLCSPLRRPVGAGSGPGPVSFRYSKPYATSGGDSGTLELLRCATTKAVVLSRCAVACQPQLGAGLLSWLTNDRRYAVRDLKAGRTVIAMDGDAGGRPLHTSQALFRTRYLATQPAPSYQQSFRILIASRAQAFAAKRSG